MNRGRQTPGIEKANFIYAKPHLFWQNEIYLTEDFAYASLKKFNDKFDLYKNRFAQTFK